MMRSPNLLWSGFLEQGWNLTIEFFVDLGGANGTRRSRSAVEWRRFLANMRQRTLIDSDNVIYKAVDGLFRAFCCRAPPQQVIDLGNELPCVMRSMLVWR